MSSAIRWALLAGLVVLGDARAGLFDKLDYDRATQPPIRIVALVPVAESRKLLIRNKNSAGGQAATLLLPFFIGAIVGASAEVNADNENSRKFAQALNERKLGFAVPLANAIRAELLKNGMRFVYLTNQRVTLTEDKKDIDFNGIGTNADAIMFLYLGETGFVSGSFSTTYEPHVVVGVKMVDARTRKPIFARYYCVGCTPATTGVELLPVEANAMKFGNFEQILQGLDQAVESVRGEHRKIAARVVSTIAPPMEAKPPAPAQAEPVAEEQKKE